MQVKVRKRVEINCSTCNKNGMESHSLYHNDVEWSECSKCGGTTRIERWAKYWVPVRENGTVPDPEEEGIKPTNIHKSYEVV